MCIFLFKLFKLIILFFIIILKGIYIFRNEYKDLVIRTFIKFVFNSGKLEIV